MDHGTRAISKYKIARTKENDHIDVNIHVPKLRTDNLNLKTWGSSYVLAGRLSQIDLDLKLLSGGGIQILELGAGTGLVGLSAAAIWRAHVVLTDLAPVVPGLALNISANEQSLSSNGGRATCGTLDWDNPVELHLYEDCSQGEKKVLSNKDNKASVILAADTIYWDEHPRMLSKAIFAWLRPDTSSRVIISYPLRVSYLDAIRELWELLESGGLEAIEEGKAETADEWDDENSHEWSVWRWRNDIT